MSEEKQLWIRGLPQEVRDRLEQEARESHRTLSGQVVWILEQYVKDQGMNVRRKREMIAAYERENYTRADELADQANADYYDEIARQQ